jgi:hypothetical protein
MPLTFIKTETAVGQKRGEVLSTLGGACQRLSRQLFCEFVEFCYFTGNGGRQNRSLCRFRELTFDLSRNRMK